MTGRTAIAAGATAAALAAVVYTIVRNGGDEPASDVGLVPIRDVLVARDGEVHEGRLERCVAASCRLGDRHFERNAIASIGLGVETTTPPPVEDPSRDELHLREGEVVHEPLAQIDADRVFAGARSFARKEVAWVHLAREPEERDEALGGAPREPGAPFDEPIRPPRRHSETPPPPREPNRARVKPCPSDRPLGGEVEYTYTVKDRDYQRCSGTAQLWFRLHPLPTPWPGTLHGVWQSDAITYRLLNDGCTPVPNDRGQVCVAPAQPEVCGTVVIGEVGPFGVNLIGAPGSPIRFTPLDPELDFMTLPDEIRHRVETPLRCFEPHGGSTGSWMFPVIGTVTAFGTADCSSGSAGVCVAPTRCVQAEGEQQRDCMLHPERYAVIPFAGSDSVAWDSGHPQEINRVETIRDFRWNVCCGCGEPPSGCAARPPGGCEQEAEALARLVGRLRALAEAYRYHERDFRCAELRRDEWRDRVWGPSGSLAGFSATLPSATPGAGGPRYQNLVALLPLLHRLLSADLSALSQIESTIDVAANDTVMNYAQARALQMLRQLYRDWYERSASGADLKAMARMYKRDIRNIKQAFGDMKEAGKALQAVAGLIDMAFAASELAEDIAAYAEWRQEAQGNQQAMEDAQDQMSDVQRQIDALRWRCPNLPPPPREEPPAIPERPCPERPDGSHGGAPSASLLPEPASPPAADFALASTGDTSKEADLAALRERFSALAAIEERAIARTADEIVPLLAPFLFHQTEGLPQELLVELLRDVRPHLEALIADLEEADALGVEIESATRRLAPQLARSSASARAPAGSGLQGATLGSR